LGGGFSVDTSAPPTIRFGVADATSVVVLSDTTLFCIAPAGPASTAVDVEIVTSVGAVTSAGAYTYLSGPVVNFDITWTDVLGQAHSGKLSLELFDEDAPLHVENLLAHTNNGMYDQVLFHRVIDGFMIQGGDFESGDGTGGYAANFYGFGDPDDQSTWTVPDEADNGLGHIPGALSMAKTSAPNSGGSQFFFVDRDSTPSHLDGVHTVFGRAAYGLYDGSEVSGLDIVDFISQVETSFSDVPVQPVTIVSAQELGGGTAAFSVDGPGWSGQPWNSAALLQAAATPQAPGWSRAEGGGWSGTRGVFRTEVARGDRLVVRVRALVLGEEPVAPIVFAERAGVLSLGMRELSGTMSERSYEVRMDGQDRVLVFVPRAPLQWVKAWVESPGPDEE
jgi:cyclophilin family peptidyl-prolyl cis-trans isomerase